MHIFADEEEANALLTIDLTRVPDLVVDEDDYALIVGDVVQSIRIEMVYPETFKSWANAMERYVGEQLPDDVRYKSVGEKKYDEGYMEVPDVQRQTRNQGKAKAWLL